MKQTTLFVIFAIGSFTVVQAQNLFKTMTYGDTTRTYRIYIPSIYDSTQPVPLVMALHGLGDNANNFQGVGFNQIANTENFIAVYPNALTDPILQASGWNAGMHQFNTTDDVGFLNALLDTIMTEYAIDTNRIYCTGFSLGGFMTYRLACELGDRLAAVASVAGSLPAPSIASCSSQRTMPVMHIHGTSDQTIPYNYGVIYFVVTNLGADSTTHYWAGHNDCTSPATRDSVPDTKNDGLTFEKFSYGGCNDSSEVILFKATGMTHTWPYTPANDIDATEEIWEFFSRHQKVAPDTSTSINEIENEIDVYPNPTNNLLFAKFSNGEICDVQLINSMGQVVARKEHVQTIAEISLNTYPNGLYLLLIETKNSVTWRRVIKQ